MTVPRLFAGDDLPHEFATGSRLVFDRPWLRVRVDDVRLPSGRASQRAVVERPKSVVIIPVTTEGDVLLIRQFRHAVNQYLIELPAGLIDPGEDALATAARELAEEAGYEPSTMRLLTTVYMSPGYTDEQTAYVLAEGCRPVTHEPDPDEPIRIAKVPLAEVAGLLMPGETQVIQAQAMLGLLWLLRVTTS